MEVIINQLGNIELIPQQIPELELNVNPVSIKGDKGEKGDTGEQGIQGIQGVKGDKGDTGEDGISAYEIALQNGFVGTEDDWMNQLYDRANHTGTQPISSIDNLQNELNNKESVIITGTTGQYWRGDKTFQTLDKTAVGLSNVDNTSDSSKPISNATQTALDLKAPLASPTFTGNLILPNNSRIDNIEHFYQITKPITRGDGSALVIGDRWWKTDDGTEWYWNGTYWLGARFSVGMNIINSDMIWRIGNRDYGLFLHFIEAVGRVASDPPNWDINNYWRTSIMYSGGAIHNLAILDSTTGYVGGGDLHFYRRFTINSPVQIIPRTDLGGSIIFAQIRAVGSPTGAGAGGSQLSYYYICSFLFP